MEKEQKEETKEKVDNFLVEISGKLNQVMRSLTSSGYLETIL